MKHRVLLKQAEGGGFDAWVPAIPGLESRGDTQELALEHIRDSIRAHYELAAAQQGPNDETIEVLLDVRLPGEKVVPHAPTVDPDSSVGSPSLLITMSAGALFFGILGTLFYFLVQQDLPVFVLGVSVFVAILGAVGLIVGMLATTGED